MASVSMAPSVSVSVGVTTEECEEGMTKNAAGECGMPELLCTMALSVTTMAALFVIQFIYGWNQYLWPLLITTKDSMQTIVIGIKKMLVATDELAEWQLAMATAVLAILPPVAVVIFMQRLFVRGLVQTEK